MDQAGRPDGLRDQAADALRRPSVHVLQAGTRTTISSFVVGQDRVAVGESAAAGEVDGDGGSTGDFPAARAADAAALGHAPAAVFAATEFTALVCHARFVGASRRVEIGAVVMTTLLMLGCGEDYRRRLTDGFDAGIGVDGDAEGNFRYAMANYHMEVHDIDCMVIQAFNRSSPDRSSPQSASVGGVGYWWSSEELNTFAERCGIDVSKLWYMVD